MDDALKYTLWVVLVYVNGRKTDGADSLQFDPAPRAGEPLVTRRPPDYVSAFQLVYSANTNALYQFL